MAGFELFHLYIGCLVFGVGYSVITFLLGSLGGHDGGGGHDVGHDVGHGDAGGHGDSGPEAGPQSGLSVFSPLMVATFATVFGGLGLITLGLFGSLQVVPAGLANIVSMLVASSLALVLSSYFSYFLVKVFVKSETSSNVSTSKLIGREAEAMLDLEPGKIGEIAYIHGGSRTTGMARLVEGSAPIKRGGTVEIVSISENIHWVKPADPTPEI